MASAPPAIRVQAAANYHAAQQAITNRFSATVFDKYAITWRQWQRFCSWLLIAPDPKDIEDPIPFLQVFVERVRAVLLYAQGKHIKKRSFEQYLRSIRQTFASVGSNDPRHNCMGKLDFRMGGHLVSYQKEDSPQTRLRPLPVSVIQALGTAFQGTTVRNIAISDLTWVALFFLLRPGEYCKGGTYTSQHPFRLKDV